MPHAVISKHNDNLAETSGIRDTFPVFQGTDTFTFMDRKIIHANFL